MKIAVWHNLPSGGGKRALHGHVAGLVARGHQVEAWCPETADDRYLPLSELIPEHRLPFRVPQASGSPLDKLKAGLHDNPLTAEMDRHSQVCADEILRGGFDLVFAAPCRFFIVPRIGHFLRDHGLPLCLYLQEPYRHRYEALPELPWLAPLPESLPTSFLRRWRRKAGDALRLRRLRADARRELEDAKCYDLILVNSYFSRESVVRSYGLDARVCYLGFDAANFRRLDPPPPKERFIIGLGSMQNIKGVETAIEAVACLPAPRPPLIWVANSENPAYRREMESLAVQRQVDFQVRLRIEDKLLVDLLNRASLLLYTSRLEPFGYAPIEANACGTPVVAVAEGGIRETVFDGVNGLLCDRAPALLAQAMQRLLDDPDLADQLAAAGAQKARSLWAPEEATNRLEDHLQTLVQARQARRT
ncbi:MAG: glycosyltransferase family 4 protein [Rhodospirillales bacterium]|nr:glycosyltransferase family 4 protein [Acetobacter sp.]